MEVVPTVYIETLDKNIKIAFFSIKNRIIKVLFFKKRANLKKIGVKSNKKLKKWVKNYFQGKSGKFPLKISLQGTPFQLSVWRAIQKIPRGKTLSYGSIADKIGCPRAVRAVGTACGKNPLPIIVPCHRVVAKNGIGGFSPGLKIKKQLLRLESK